MNMKTYNCVLNFITLQKLQTPNISLETPCTFMKKVIFTNSDGIASDAAGVAAIEFTHAQEKRRFPSSIS